MNYINLLITIKNAYLNKQVFLYVPATNFNYNLVKILKFQGYIKDFCLITINNKKFLFLDLNGLKKIIGIKFFKSFNKIKILNLKKISKLTKYSGLYLISTSKGILSLSLANKLKIGGQLICYIW